MNYKNNNKNNINKNNNNSTNNVKFENNFCSMSEGNT